MMKPKSIMGMILFLTFFLSWSGISFSQVIRITDNNTEDSFPKTSKGVVVWQGFVDGDMEIFLYNANYDTGPFQITDNTYNDVQPETDGRYVAWVAGSARWGELFVYDIENASTIQVTDDAFYDHSPKIVDGFVVWVSHAIGDDGINPGAGDIFLYDIAENISYNVSGLVDPDNTSDDFAFRFDGSRILWARKNNQNQFSTYYYDIDVGQALLAPEGTTINDNQQIEGDFLVFSRIIDGHDREILVRDLQVKRGGQITDNDIEDTQPCIRDNIIVWKGGEGENSDIYLYEIQPLFADAGYDMELDIATIEQMVLQGRVGGKEGRLTYRWLYGGKPLTKLRTATDGNAPLNLKLKPVQKLLPGSHTFTLEVSDGSVTVSDEVELILEDWSLTLNGPDSRSEYEHGTFPVFTWDSKNYLNFKIQFSKNKKFHTKATLSYPENKDEWSNEKSFIVDEGTAKQLILLLKKRPALHWRILAKDRYGNVKKSESRVVIIEKEKKIKNRKNKRK